MGARQALFRKDETMERFDMKKFEAEYSNLVLDCTEAKENAVKAGKQNP